MLSWGVGLVVLGLTLACGGGAPEGTWERTFGDQEAQWTDALAVAPNGDAVVLMYDNGELEVDGARPPGLRDDDGPDSVVVRFSPQGDVLWSRGTATDHWRDVAASDTLTVVAGLGPQATKENRYRMPNPDEAGGHVLTAFDAEGEERWSFDAPGLWGIHEVERHGELWVGAGRFRDTLELNGQSWPSSRRGGDSVVVWLDDDGALRDYYVGPGFLPGDQLAVAPDGSAVLAGNGIETWMMSVAPGETKPRWVENFGSPDVIVKDLAVSPSGGVFISGHFGAPVDLGTGEVELSSGSFIRGFDPTTEERIVAVYDDHVPLGGPELGIDDNAIWAFGSFRESVAIDGRDYTAPQGDAYLVEYGFDLSVRSVETMGWSERTNPGGVHLGPTHRVIAGQCGGRRQDVECKGQGDVWVQRRPKAPSVVTP